jgi:adenosylhomocysteine nucleosidase
VNELKIDDPCVLFALSREAGPFLQEFRPQQRFPGAPCWARFCGPAWLTVLVMQTGIGAERMQQAVDWLLTGPMFGNLLYRPRVILSAGYAGALRDGLAVGDIVLANEVLDCEGNSWATTWPVKLEGEWQPPLHQGRLLTEAKLIGEPALKRQLGEKHDALAADMESAVLARACQGRGIPFGCVRAISDDLQMALSPHLVRLLGSNRVSPARLTASVLRRPGLVGQLWRLARDTQLASRQLARALGELLTLTLPWSEELEKA